MKRFNPYAPYSHARVDPDEEALRAPSQTSAAAAADAADDAADADAATMREPELDEPLARAALQLGIAPDEMDCHARGLGLRAGFPVGAHGVTNGEEPSESALALAAERLGVDVDDLRADLGIPREGAPQHLHRDEVTAAAAQLGIDPDELRAHGRKLDGRRDAPAPDERDATESTDEDALASAAEQLGHDPGELQARASRGRHVERAADAHNDEDDGDEGSLADALDAAAAQLGLDPGELRRDVDDETDAGSAAVGGSPYRGQGVTLDAVRERLCNGGVTSAPVRGEE